MRKLLALVILIPSLVLAQDSYSPVGSFDIWGDGANSGELNQFTTHRECETHYASSALFGYQVWLALGECMAELEGEEGRCSSIQEMPDGEKVGRLWKPISERTAGPVALMPPEYRFATAEVVDQDGNQVSNQRIRDCCSHNGGRDHAYFYGFAVNYPKEVLLKYDFGNGRTDCFRIPDPVQRYD